MPDQETHGRFTPPAWNLLKKTKLNEDEQEKLNFLISLKIETIEYDELKAMIYVVVNG